MRVTLCDVGPRDGLQNEPDVLPPDTRADLVNRLAAAGLPGRERGGERRPALEQEGLHFEGYVDIFDAGPVLQARVSELRAMRESVVVAVDATAVSDETEPVLVSNTVLQDFRMIVSHANPGQQ